MAGDEKREREDLETAAEAEQAPAAEDAPPDEPGDGGPATGLAEAWQATGIEGGTAEQGEDEVDPELMALPAPRRRRHPVVSVLVIALSVYLMVWVWPDFRYFFEPETPRDHGTAAELAKKEPPLNRFITVRGSPDRKHALLLEGRIGGFDSFFRLLGGGNKVYVQQHRAKRSTDRVVSGVHSGRLVAFAELPYRDAVAEYFTRSLNTAHDIDFAELARAKREGRRRVVDQRGVKLEVDDRKPLWINVSFPDEWLIQFSKRAYATQAEARKQLRALKLPYVADAEGSPSFWRFVVIADSEEAAQLREVFRVPALHAGVIPRQVSYTARWPQLRVEGKTLVIDADDPTFPARYRLRRAGGDGSPAALVAERKKPVVVPSSAVKFITTSSKFEMPADAVVLIAGRRPGDKWFYLVLYLVLAGFIVFNAIAIGVRFRAR